MAAPATVKKPSRNARILAFITALVGVTTVVLNSAQIKDYLLKPKDVVTDLSNRDMLEKIFGGVFIDSLHAGKWKEPWSEEIAGWLPGGKEKRDKDDSQNRSGDGCFYTCVEKIIRYRTLSSVTRAVVIFGTHEVIDGNLSDAHVAAPLISLAAFVEQPDETWKLTRFKRHQFYNGTFGKFQGCDVDTIGKDKIGLQFSTFTVFQGEQMLTVDILDGDDLNMVFNYTLHSSYHSSSDSTVSYSIDGKLTFDKSGQREFYDLCVDYEGEWPTNREQLADFDWSKDECFLYSYTTCRYEVKSD